MFLLVSVRHVGAHPDELQHGVSIQSSINLGKTFPQISLIRIIPSTQILARVFVYLPPFISQTLDFICPMVLILISFGWRDTENQQYCWPTTPNIVGCYISCCVPLHTLLHVVGCCCVLLRKVWNRSNFSANNSQQFLLIRLHSSSNIVGATHAHYAWFTKTYGLYPSHDALQRPNIVGSCCIRLHTTANTHVVASFRHAALEWAGSEL